MDDHLRCCYRRYSAQIRSLYCAVMKQSAWVIYWHCCAAHAVCERCEKFMRVLRFCLSSCPIRAALNGCRKACAKLRGRKDELYGQYAIARLAYGSVHVTVGLFLITCGRKGEQGRAFASGGSLRGQHFMFQQELSSS